MQLFRRDARDRIDPAHDMHPARMPQRMRTSIHAPAAPPIDRRTPADPDARGMRALRSNRRASIVRDRRDPSRAPRVQRRR
jgi:hypothetical protein